MARTGRQLVAPFPWYGGKSRWVSEVWEHLGEVGVYVEPFFGSGAVLLASQPHAREIVCDTDGMVCNLFRAISHDYQAVAYWADYPTVHQDLTARRHWLAKWRQDNSDSLSVDPDFCDPKAAGWWAWCLSHWIGPVNKMLELKGGGDKIPYLGIRAGGKGVSAQRIELSRPDKIPFIKNGSGSRGVSQQRVDLSRPDKIPNIPSWGGARGVSVQRTGITISEPMVDLSRPDKIPNVSPSGSAKGVAFQRRDIAGAYSIGSGARLIPWFEALAIRLANVIVLNRDWKAALTPSKLQHTPTAPKPTVGIFLDPPYLLEGRGDVYDSDSDVNNLAALESYAWAVENGDRFRIAYACAEGDFDLPDGWSSSKSRTFNGHKVLAVRQKRRDIIFYSPACHAKDEEVVSDAVSGDRLL